jgi:hypothetical protein
MDLVVVVGESELPAVMAILRNQRDGTLAPEVADWPMARGAYGLTIADYDLDGRPDVGVVSTEDGGPGWFDVVRQGEDGQFRTALRTEIEDYTYSVAGGDFDDDGRPDVAFVKWGSLSYLFNSASPSPTPVAIAADEPDATAECVRLVWHCPACGDTPLPLQRREGTAPWTEIARLAPAGGRFVFEDRAVVAGHRYGYRLVSPTDPGIAAASEQWVTVPVRAVFALYRPHPNPANDALDVALSLAPHASARLELFDVGGRRVVEHAFPAEPGGEREFRIGAARLPAGLYFLRLTQAAHTAGARVIVTH